MCVVVCVCVCGVCVVVCTCAQRQGRGLFWFAMCLVQCLVLGTAGHMVRWMDGRTDGWISESLNADALWIEFCALWFLISSFFVMGQNENIPLG